MKRLSIIVLAALLCLATSCNTTEPSVPPQTPTPTPDIDQLTPITPEPTDNPDDYEPHYEPYDFSSEEEFVAFAQSFQSEAQHEIEPFGVSSEREARFVDMISRYYRLKNPPPEATIRYISATEGNISVAYNTQKYEADGSREWMVVRYSNYYSFDIEASPHWTRRPFPDESYIFEVDELKYYIQKGTGGGYSYFLWSIQWYNADGYYMSATFPYRYTAEEVLAFVSDIERVEIG